MLGGVGRRKVFGLGIKWNAKLTESKVRQMRRLRAKGWIYSRIGERFGVTKMTAFQAVTGRSWAHVDGPGPVVGD